VPLIAFAVLVVLAIVVVVPISLVQRFRVATRRRPARGWVATLNLAAVTLSTVLLMVGAYVTGRWIPDALPYTLAGFAVGSVLGALGLALTRWEYVSGRLHYTPSWWLVTIVTLVVTARVLYGFWRSWQTWRASVDAMAWVSASGLETSLSAGAVVLGYYLIFWAGVHARVRAHTRGASIR
jgi:hypothetical protein